MNSNEFNISLLDQKTIDNYKNKAQKTAYDLINMCLEINRETGKTYNIATAESLTAGLIMATLVDIPIGGIHKYGCFGVYDTDAKRVFLGVKVKDVYTHLCASQMSIGVLQNSNASIAIAVTGNAMPYNKESDRLGEVFISIAGYSTDSNIVYITKSINACLTNSDDNTVYKKCSDWYNVIKNDVSNRTFNKRIDTEILSQIIRYITVQSALELCNEFLKKNENILIIPSIIKERYDNNKNPENNLPPAKYNNMNQDNAICLNEPPQDCDTTGIRNDNNTNTLKLKGGGKRQTKKGKTYKKKNQINKLFRYGKNSYKI